MTIQINTGENLENNARTKEYYSDLVNENLDRFTEYLTRVEVHMADVNAGKSGPADKKCTIEARMSGRDPIAVTAQDEKVEKAFNAALGKVKASMTTIVGKMQEKR